MFRSENNKIIENRVSALVVDKIETMEKWPICELERKSEQAEDAREA